MFILHPPAPTCAISVIIPMYNAEKYVGKCLESLLAQTFQDFEVIIINDCSTDNSRAIAESYLGRFGGRMKIFDNETNLEVSATRNKGLLLSCGEYVYFMDADDLLLLTGLEKLYTTAKKFDAEIVNMSGFYKMSADEKNIEVFQKIDRLFANDEDEFVVDDNLESRVKNPKPFTFRFMGTGVLRLARRDFLIKNKLFFPEKVKRCEDVVWKYGFLLSSKKIVNVRFIIYFYRMSEDSKTRKKRNRFQYINSRMTTVIDGIKWIDDVMNGKKFFEENPTCRYGVLQEFITDLFGRLLPYTRNHKIPAFEVYKAVKQDFGKSLGKYDVLVAELCSLIDSQRRELDYLHAELKKIKPDN